MTIRPASAVVVTALDRNYFPYVQELLHSFHACGAANTYDFAVLDAGLTAEQTDWLRRFGVAAIVKPDWPFSGMEAQPEWYKASLCRPFFPDYFDRWDVVIYMDSDSWFQSPEVLDYAVAGAVEDGFCAVPVVDRNHWPLTVPINAAYSMHWHKDCLSQFFGQEIANQFELHPILHGSFFAGRRDAPHWRLWQELMMEGLRNKIRFDIDQASMTVALHRSQLRVHFLPIYHHWVSHLAPVGLDTRNGTYVEPYLPHQPLSSITLAANTKTEPVLVRTVDGRLLSRLLRYGREREVYTVNVTINGVPHAFDGVAMERFRAAVFEAVSGEGATRFVAIGTGSSANILAHVVRTRSWSGTIVEPRAEAIAQLQHEYAGIPGVTFAQMAIGPSAGGAGTFEFERFAQNAGIDGFDVLQIDAEGNGGHILAQLDLHRYAPKCVHLGVTQVPPDGIAAAIVRLHGAGYAVYAMENGENILGLRHDVGLRHFGIL